MIESKSLTATMKQMQEALKEYHYYTIDAGLPNQSMLNKGYAAYQAGKQALKELESQEPVALPCCGYTDASAVKWNPLNGIVQCHNCGQNYTTSEQSLNERKQCLTYSKADLKK